MFGFGDSIYYEIAGTFNKCFISFIAISIETLLKFNNSVKSKSGEVFIENKRLHTHISEVKSV